MTKISTHAPLAGRDERSSKKSIPLWHFNPRAPCGARHDRESNGEGYGISTHAPLAGRDTEQVITKTPSKYFNPRAPCGARQKNRLYQKQKQNISTHAPLAGRDIKLLPLTTSEEEFQPTRPLRGATITNLFIKVHGLYFNPRAPCGARLPPTMWDSIGTF